MSKLLFKLFSGIMFYTLFLTISFAETIPSFCFRIGSTAGGSIVAHGFVIQKFILINFLIFGVTNLLIGIHYFINRKKIISILFFVFALLFLFLPVGDIYFWLLHLYLDSLCPHGYSSGVT